MSDKYISIEGADRKVFRTAFGTGILILFTFVQGISLLTLAQIQWEVKNG